MRRDRLLQRLIAATFAAGAATTVCAAGPSIIMIYGDGLPQPLFVVQHAVTDLARYAFLWCGGGGSHVPSSELAARRSLNLAIFWIDKAWTDAAEAKRLTTTLRPEDAAQHGRLYPPADQRTAWTVVTEPPRRVGATLDEQERRRLPASDAEFVRACPVSAAELALAGLAVNPAIPAADPAKYRHIQDAQDWRNPWISVRPDAIDVVSPALSGGRKTVPASELRVLLLGLPVSAWPYGRVIAGSDPGPRTGRRDDERIRRHHQFVDRLLEILNVRIDWWPPA